MDDQADSIRVEWEVIFDVKQFSCDLGARKFISYSTHELGKFINAYYKFSLSFS